MRLIIKRATTSRAWRIMLVGVLLTIGFAGSVVGASAQAGAETIHACQSRYTGQIRIIQPSQNCVANEVRLEFQSAAGADDQQDQIDALAARVAALEGRMDTAESDIDNLETRATNLETRATNLETRATNLETRATNVENRAGALEGRMDTAETAIVTLDTRVTNIRDFFTGVANDIRGCFTDPNAVFSITIGPYGIPGFTLIPEVLDFPPITVVPEITIGVPFFNATTVVSCLNSISTSTTQ